MGEEFKIEIDSKKIKLAIFVFFLGIFFPIFFKHENFKIYESINYGLEHWDKEYVLIAMFKLVLLNTIRSNPIYLSMIILFEAIVFKNKNKEIIYRKIIFITFLIPITYFIINLFYNIYLPLGKTSFVSIIWFFYYVRLDFKNVSYIQKYFVFLFFLIGVQWLDVSPFLKFLGVGEITLYLNQVVIFMGAEKIFILLGMTFFLFFMIVSILLLYFFKSQEKNLQIQKAELENRYLKEVHHVVHDLKTPIFSIGTLIEILKMKETEIKKLDYLGRIEGSIEKLNIMIEEILESKKQKKFKIEEIMKFVFAIISVNEKSKFINYENYTKGRVCIFVNRILLSRAIINIIINSWEANSKGINLVLKKYGKFLLIKIEDYGDGIDEDIEKLMEEGFSTKGSSGKGLPFVKNVLEKMNAKFNIIKKEQGVIVYIVLEGVAC